MLAASILDAFWMTHLHYCQRTTASENWFLRPAGYDLETDRKRDKWLNGKALNRTAREADQIHYCQLPKELAFQDRVPTENQNPVPCVRAVVRHAACIAVHIVLDRYPCIGVQISACGKPGLPVCALPQQCLSVFLNAHTSVDNKRPVRCDCATDFAHTTEESLARDWRICVSTGAIFCLH